MTLRPDSTINTVNLVPLRDHAQAIHCLLSNCPTVISAAYSILIDVVGNVVVFFPIGFSLAGALGDLPYRRRLRTVIMTGVVLSTGIELIQLIIPSRATDVDDVLFNTIGTGLGAIVIVATQHWLERSGDKV